MSRWEAHLLTPQSLGASWDDGTGAVLEALVAHVRRKWRMLEEGIRAQEAAGRRNLLVGREHPLPAVLFHNPSRLTSVTADPRPDAWCPLCAANVPHEEQGIAVGTDFVALPNPAPIVRDHVVFAHREHVAQALEPCLEVLAWLLGRSGPDVVFLYNGPTSGASSPYHRHFQAGRASDLPLTAQRGFHAKAARSLPWGRVEGIEAGSRRFLWLTILRASFVCDALSWTLRLLSIDGEFPLNLLLWRQDDGVVGALFPRGRHRPSCFFLEDKDRIVVSPGSVEMAGLVVLPRRDDWQRLDPVALEGIYREVTIDDDAWRSLLAHLAG